MSDTEDNKEEKTEVTVSLDGGKEFIPLGQLEAAMDAVLGPHVRIRDKGAFVQTKNLGCYLKTVKLSVVSNKATGQDHRMADCTFDIQLTPELAMEIGKDIFRHTYERVGNKWEPNREIQDVTFSKVVELQQMIYRSHPEVEAGGGVIQNVSIAKIQVKQPDPALQVMFLIFVLSFEISDNAIAAGLVINLLQQRAYLTFDSMNQNLF